MTFNEFSAKIKHDLRRYDSSGLIDDIKILEEVDKGLSHFGFLPTQRYEKVFKIKNGKVELPYGFKMMELIVKCEPLGCEKPKETEDILQDIHFWKSTEKITSGWNECDDCCADYEDSVVVEKYYINKTKPPIKFYYNNPTYLKVLPGLIRQNCTEGCPNLRVQQSPYEVGIVGYDKKVLQFNFKEGNVYIIYLGLPEDEEGFPIIPDDSKKYLSSYIEYKVKAILLEDIYANGEDTPGDRVGQVLQLFQQKERDYFSKAIYSLKADDLDFGVNEYANNIKQEIEVFNFG